MQHIQPDFIYGEMVVRVDPSTGPIDLLLFSAKGHYGKIVHIMNSTVYVHTITVWAATDESIDGQAAASTSVAYGHIALQSFGRVWERCGAKPSACIFGSA